MLYGVRCFCFVLTSLMTSARSNLSTSDDDVTALTHSTAYNVGVIMEDVKMLLSRCESSESFQSEPRDCSEVKSKQPANGLAKIVIPEHKCDKLAPLAHPITVYCDQTTIGGGWIVMLRREDDGQKFPTRPWIDYKQGFGNPTGSFWLGLENVYRLTYTARWTLRVELEDWEGNIRFANYEFFGVSSEEEGYRLYIDGYSGDAGDSLQYHNGQKFSTIDRDNDIHPDPCATRFDGAWWYNYCVTCCLTGKYYSGEHSDAHHGLYWRAWKGPNYSYKRAEMKIRRAE